MSKRKYVTTLLLCFLLGLFGTHRLYSGKGKQFALTIGLCFVGLILLVVGTTVPVFVLTIIGSILLGGLLLWNIVEFFMIVGHKYKDKEKCLITDLK